MYLLLTAFLFSATIMQDYSELFGLMFMFWTTGTTRRNSMGLVNRFENYGLTSIRVGMTEPHEAIFFFRMAGFCKDVSLKGQASDSESHHDGIDSQDVVLRITLHAS